MLDDAQRSFHTEEFKALHIEIERLLAGMQDMVKLALAATAAVFSWLATHNTECGNGNPAFTIASFAPAIVTSFCGLYSWSLLRGVRRTGVYLAKLEAVLGHADLGWEAHLNSEAPVITRVTLAIWVVGILANIAIGVAVALSPCAFLASQP